MTHPDIWVCIALFHLYVKRDFTAQDTRGQTLDLCSQEKEGYFVEGLLLPDQGGRGVCGLSLIPVCMWLD